MIDEQSSASGHDYASDRSAIGAGYYFLGGGGIKYVVVCVCDPSGGAPHVVGLPYDEDYILSIVTKR